MPFYISAYTTLNELLAVFLYIIKNNGTTIKGVYGGCVSKTSDCLMFILPYKLRLAQSATAKLSGRDVRKSKNLQKILLTINHDVFVSILINGFRFLIKAVKKTNKTFHKVPLIHFCDNR